MGWIWVCDLEGHDGIEISIHRNLGEGFYLLGNKENYGERSEYIRDVPTYDTVPAPLPTDADVVLARALLIKQFDAMKEFKERSAAYKAPKPRKDLFGNVLAEGDIVAFNPPRYKGLTTGKILYFTPKGVTVEYVSTYGPDKTNLACRDVVKK